MNKEITKSVVDILNQDFKIPIGKLDAKYYNTPLTSNYFALDSIDLVYLYFILQRKFNIRIDQSQINDYQMNTINGIIKIIADLN